MGEAMRGGGGRGVDECPLSPHDQEPLPDLMLLFVCTRLARALLFLICLQSEKKTKKPILCRKKASLTPFLNLVNFLF